MKSYLCMSKRCNLNFLERFSEESNYPQYSSAMLNIFDFLYLPCFAFLLFDIVYREEGEKGTKICLSRDDKGDSISTYESAGGRGHLHNHQPPTDSSNKRCRDNNCSLFSKTRFLSKLILSTTFLIAPLLIFVSPLKNFMREKLQ